MTEYSGFAALLKYGDGGSPEAFTIIAQVRDINGPSESADTIEVSNRTAGTWKKFVGGMKDGGEVDFDIIYDPDVISHDIAAGLPSFLGVLKNYQLIFPDATPLTATFGAILTSFNPKAPLNDAFTADAKMKISGAPAWA